MSERGGHVPSPGVFECLFCSRLVPIEFDPEFALWGKWDDDWACPLHLESLSSIDGVVSGGRRLIRHESWRSTQLEVTAALADRLRALRTTLLARPDRLVAVIRLDDGQRALQEKFQPRDAFPFVGALERLAWRAELIAEGDDGPGDTSDSAATPTLPTTKGAPLMKNRTSAGSITLVVAAVLAIVLASQAPAADAPIKAPPKLQGTVDDRGRVKLTRAGKVIKVTRPGWYTVLVFDLSKQTNFVLSGPGVRRQTGVAFRGTAMWGVRLRSGKYTYRSTGERPTKATFVARA